MNNLKRVLSITLGGIILVGTISFGATGKVNAPNGLILRKEAKSGDNIIMTVSDKSEVEVLEKDGEWYKVKYNSHEGYLFAEYVEVEKPEEKVEEAEKTPEPEENKENQVEETIEGEEKTETTAQKQNAKSDIKIYLIPSVTAKTIGIIEKDAQITINYELNNWANITYGTTTGWVRKYFIEKVEDVKEEKVEEDKEEENTEQEEPKEDSKKDNETELTQTIIDNKKGYVDVSNSANIREKASTDSKIIERLLRNTEVTIVAEEGDFYKIKYQDLTGYISKSLISDKPIQDVTSRGNGEREVTVVEESKTVESNESEEKAEINKESTTSSEGEKIVSYAKKYVGYDYVSGGSSPKTGFDCSGLTYYVYNSFGYSMGRTCTAQSKMGKSVSRENLSAGDLIFFNNGGDGSIGHVGIYIGGGQFVHAENSRTGVRIDTINSGYYNKYYYTARRIIN